MRTQIIRKSFIVVLAGFALFLTFFSVNWSEQGGIKVWFNSAHATVGRPLSAGSVAGVHRRHERRDTRHTNHNHQQSGTPQHQ